MASLIPGYEYDIFISYRQKDNKYDGWVTEFVDNLKKELEATFKEEISVYFDINPHDGLLETHDVDASLKEKLKCLIFIPIISRTYCDPKSFAWEHEFKAFVEKASQDKFGLKVKLPNGNVASRVLPVRIHDLDIADIKECESVLRGVLRGVEFIYKEPGVNRPITPKDNEDKNLNSTSYRNQINKVALAIRDIIIAIKQHEYKPGEIIKEVVEPVSLPRKNKKAAIIAVSSILFVALIISGVLFIPKLLKPEEQLEKSVAVLPFKNDSPDEENTYFINGIMEEILIKLQKIKDLRVISRTSVEKYRGSDKPSIPEIARELGVNFIVEGSGQKYGNKFSLRIQLIRAAKESHLWAESYEQDINEVNDILSIQKQIAESIAKELKAVITPQEEVLIRQIPTRNPLAYDLFLKGNQFSKEMKQDSAIEMFSKAIDQDPGFVLAYLARAQLYTSIYFTKAKFYEKNDWESFDQLAKADLEKTLKINPDRPEVKLAKALQVYQLDRDQNKALELLDEVKTQVSNSPGFFALRSYILRRTGQWQESLEDLQQAILLDPLNNYFYYQAGLHNRLMRRYPEAIEYHNSSLSLGQLRENMICKFLIILLWKGDIDEALKVSELNANDIGYNYFYYKRQYDKLITAADLVEDQWRYFPKSLRLAEAYFLNKNIFLSRQYADSAIAKINLKIKESPEDERYYAALGYAYSYKGESKKAIENAQKAIKLKPIKLDAWQGHEKELDLAKIYILTGEYDLAMDRIEYLLTIPGDLSVPLLKIDPAYDKLRDLPRFQKILTTDYKTNY
jgi:TolB-like protein/Tfp pilus assembly protein PilF